MLLSQCVAESQRQSVALGIEWFRVRNSLEPTGFLLGKEINRLCYVVMFYWDAHWAEPSPLFAHRARLTPLKCTNEYLVLALGELQETAV